MDTSQNTGHIVILLPYGVFEPANLQYKQYLDQAFKVINSKSCDYIVLCGGLSKNDLTEARSVGDYLLAQHPEYKDKIIYEESSLTTPENLEFAGTQLQKAQLSPSSLTVICDSIRVPKVYYFAFVYFSKFMRLNVPEEEIYTSLLTESVNKRADFSKNVLLSYKKISIQGLSLDRNATEMGHQILSTLEEVAAEKYGGLKATIKELRKLQWQMELNSNR